MKRLHLERWSGQLFSPRTRPCSLRQQRRTLMPVRNSPCLRMQSTAAAPSEELILEDPPTPPTSLSPDPSAALKSAKLAALHARLALPKKLPLQTLARALVHPSADPNRSFNNNQLVRVGESILSYHVAEHLICTYPRLPMAVLFASQYAHGGPETLALIAKEWGVETAFAPGPEVDPGLLQFKKLNPGTLLPTGGRTTRSDAPFFRRGLTSRIVYDDEFGDTIKKRDSNVTAPLTTTNAYASFVKAVIGSIYLHAGRTAARTFIQQHILSRHLNMSSLFQFSHPVRDLARLCAREDFDPPTARILSETGRASISPVFVVGIYSGRDKLGEAAGSSLDEARTRASVASLKAWYLYSPGRDVNVPSDTEIRGENIPWEPVHVDIGEIVA